MKVLEFLNTTLGLLLVGFVLTTIVGAFVSEIYNRSAWRRSKRFEMLTRLLDKHESLICDISHSLGTRVFRLERVLWALEPLKDPNPLFPDMKKRVTDRWDEYYAEVVRWNEEYRGHVSRIRYLAGNELAQRFYGGRKESEANCPTTVYGHLVYAHACVYRLLKITIGPEPEQRGQSELYQAAQSAVKSLYEVVDEFLIALYRALDMSLSDREIAEHLAEPRHPCYRL